MKTTALLFAALTITATAFAQETASTTTTTSTASATTATLPVYKLEPGLQIGYEGYGESDYKTTLMINSGSTSLTVLATRPDGAAEVMYYSQSSYESKRKGGGNGYKGEPRVSVGRSIIKPDGTVEGEQAMDFKIESTLPLLPKSAVEMTSGWKTENDPDGTYREYRAEAGANPNEIIIVSEERGAHSEVYESTQKSRTTIDLQKGYPTHAKRDHTQGYGFVGGGSYYSTLTLERKMPADELTAFATDAKIYLDAYDKASAAMKDASKPDADTTKSLDTARAAFKEADSKVKLDLFKRETARALKNHETNRKYYLDRKDSKNELIGKPSPAWEAAEIDGTTKTLESYRGQVVVMDFWYRGCGWCISAMPQIKELADQYKGKPVAILGMNTDTDEKDARFVMKKLSLNYPTLRAKGINEKYSVQGFPTLVLLDQVGTIRHFHIGYSPKLREEVSKHVDELLAEKPKS